MNNLVNIATQQATQQTAEMLSDWLCIA